MEIEVADNPVEQRYEIRADGELAGFTAYRERPKGLALTHTEIDDAYEGQGLGSKLVASTLDDLRSRGLEVLPICPFVKSYIERHPEYVGSGPRVRAGALRALVLGGAPKTGVGLVAAVNPTAHPYRFRRLPTAEVASHRVPVAVTLLSRLLGLAWMRPGRAGEGLLIPRCRSVHTFGMRFAVDLAFLDSPGRSDLSPGGGSAEPGRERAERRPQSSNCRRPAGGADAAAPRAHRDGRRLRGRPADTRPALRSPRGRAIPSAAGTDRSPTRCGFAPTRRPTCCCSISTSRTPTGSMSCARFATPTAPLGATTPSSAVIVLSGRSADADRVRGLDCGADDYVVKPFYVPEITARIARSHSPSRRSSGRAAARRRDLHRRRTA